MKKIELNFKHPEPEAEELTADRAVAHILANQNTAWTWATQQRNVQGLWELWCECAEAYQACEAGSRQTEDANWPWTAQTKSTAERLTAPSAHEGAQNHRTRRLLKLARQVERLVRQLHRHVGQVCGGCEATSFPIPGASESFCS